MGRPNKNEMQREEDVSTYTQRPENEREIQSQIKKMRFHGPQLPATRNEKYSVREKGPE